MSGGITIPASLHQKMILDFKKEYEEKFGSIDDAITYGTKSDIVEKYVKDITFWKERTPVINYESSTPPSIEQICAHAICTNAVSNMLELSKKKCVFEEVSKKISSL